MSRVSKVRAKLLQKIGASRADSLPGGEAEEKNVDLKSAEDPVDLADSLGGYVGGAGGLIGGAALGAEYGGRPGAFAGGLGGSMLGSAMGLALVRASRKKEGVLQAPNMYGLAF